MRKIIALCLAGFVLAIMLSTTTTVSFSAGKQAAPSKVTNPDPVSSALPTAALTKYRALFPEHTIWQVAQTKKGNNTIYELSVFDVNSPVRHSQQVGSAFVTKLVNYKLILTGTGKVLYEAPHPITVNAVPVSAKKAAADWIRPVRKRAAANTSLVEWLAHQEKGGERQFTVRYILSSVESYSATLKADGTIVRKSTVGNKKNSNK